MQHRCSQKRFVARCALGAATLCAYVVLALGILVTSCPQSRALDAMSGSQQDLIATSGTPHTCALTKTSDAGVRCWGSNMSGQLGDGTNTQRTTPVDVTGLSSGVASIGVGNLFSCALLTNGQVKCWGNNSMGQLGNSNYATSFVPVSVLNGATGTPLTGVTKLSVGGNHACVILSSGGAKCWGANQYGQLGNGSHSASVSPVDVTGYTSNVKTIDAGLYHTCLVTLSPNRIYCFGSNSDFQLGDGTGVDAITPVMVSGYFNAIEVTAGDSHSCARMIGGDMICWGNNTEAQLGDGHTLVNTLPVTVNVIGTDGERVTAGTAHTCATRASDGEVLCWGRGAQGQVGDGTSTQRTDPTATNPSVKSAVDISAGGSHTCAWMSTCNAKCWGANSNGQLGDGTTNNSSSPVSITVCINNDPTPTPTPTATPTRQPDACSSEVRCVPDGNLSSALDPAPPKYIDVVATTSDKVVKVSVSQVRLGIPTDLAKRQLLRKKLSKFFRRTFPTLSGALKLFDIYYVFSIVKAPSTSSNSVEALGMPTKYRVETRKRRVTTRLAPGPYIAKVTVRLKDKKGRTFATGTTAGQSRFTVR